MFDMVLNKRRNSEICLLKKSICSHSEITKLWGRGRSRHSLRFYKIGFPKNFEKIKNNKARISFQLKLYLKEIPAKVFSVNFAKFLRIHFVQNISWTMLLKRYDRIVVQSQQRRNSINPPRLCSSIYIFGSEKLLVYWEITRRTI